jgi:hypothetical protein
MYILIGATFIVMGASYCAMKQYYKEILGTMLSCYSDVRHFYKETISRKVTYEEQKPIIMDMRVITKNMMYIIPDLQYDDVINNNWSYLQNLVNNREEDSLLHIMYKFREKKYKIILTTYNTFDVIKNYKWMIEGFSLDFDEIHTSITDDKILEELPELMRQYAGPLGDFYYNVGIILNPSGFLTPDMNHGLIKKNNYIEIEDGIGSSITYKC